MPDAVFRCEDRLRRLEAAVLAGVLLLLVVVRIHAVDHAGGLWRDEVHSLELAKDRSQPAWLDSFPSLWIYSVRAWLAVAPDSDSGCRLFGFLCGVALVFAAWWAPRVSKTTGWASLALLCLHPVVIVYGGEFRGYALGVTFQLLLFGVVARLAMGTATRRHWIALPAVSLLAVQFSYTNCFMLLAVSAGAGIVCLLDRRWTALAAIGLNGLAAAASMAPYALHALPALGDVMIIARGDFGEGWYVGWFLSVLEKAGIAGPVWIALPVVLLYVCARRFASRSAAELPGAAPHAAVFAITTLLVGTAGFFLYLDYLRVHTESWYYMPVMALWAFCCDLMLAALVPQQGRARGARIAVVSVLVLASLPAVWSASAVRLTNVDLLAKAVAERARPGDLVVVHPWFMGITFSRYYRGSAPWTTFPDVLRQPWTGHREFKQRMTQTKPIAADLERMEETLRSGGRIWLVGQALPSPGDAGELPPAPGSPFGWSEVAYAVLWSKQAANILQRRAETSEPVPLELPSRVQQVEAARLFSFTGWRE